MNKVDDFIYSPLNIIENIYGGCDATNNWKHEVYNTFDHFLENKESLSKVPYLNETPLHLLKGNQLVQFHGMIQDMFDQEFYLDAYEVQNSAGEIKIKPGMCLDNALSSPSEKVIIDSANCVPGDRQSYYCIATPGLNNWIKEIYASYNAVPRSDALNSELNRHKRTAPVEEEDDAKMEESSDQIASTSITESKRFCDIKNNTKNGNKEEKNILNFPVPGETGAACILKTYKDYELCLNDLIKAVGVVSFEVISESIIKEDQEFVTQNDFLEDNEMKKLPSSLVPRLHVLSVFKVKHCNPLLDTSLPTPSPTVDMKRVRQILRNVLTEALLGDTLAAEFMISHLCSSVYLRQDVLPLGKYSLNISGINQDLQKANYVKHFVGLLQLLTTHCVAFDMTLNNMNSFTFVPTKDYENNRLVSGLLQLPSDCHLVVDETKLSNGQLDSTGLENLTSLGNLINWQKVEYDFKFHKIEQQTNVSVLMFSEGKAMIKTDCQIHLQPNHCNVTLAFANAKQQLATECINDIRKYLTLARMGNYSIDQDLQKTVENDFVNSRQNEDGMSADDLHMLLTVARLTSLSCGEGYLTSDIWNSVKILESERKTRLKQKTLME